MICYFEITLYFSAQYIFVLFVYINNDNDNANDNEFISEMDFETFYILFNN